MKVKDKVPTLEEQYLKILKGQPVGFPEPDFNLEQPYFGEVVQTVTTYSVCEKPKLITG